MITASMYVKLSIKMFREFYNRALKMTLNPKYYVFDEKHDYAIEAVELLSRIGKE